MGDASAFTQVAPNRWSLDLESERPINEVVAFITQPLAAESALGCHVASAPFEQASWHYLGSITNECPTVVFHTRLVWSARDAIPTRVQLGVELQPKAQMAQRPPEKVCPLTRKHTANTLALTRSRACDFPLTPRTRAHTELVCTETPRRIFAATCALRCQPR